MPPNNWIDDILAELEHVETPRSWLWWSLCCSISAAAGNNYYLRTLKGAVIFKPNLYVILLGESGLGKEFPVSLAGDLVEKADVTRVIRGRSSIQAIVKELATSKTRADGKPPFTDSRGFIVNGELSTAIIQDPDSLTILTDLYDRKSSWTNLLKGDGAEKLKEPYITALFGSSPAHFYDSIPAVNMEGGYIGRNLIIKEEKRYKDTDLLDETDDLNEPDDRLVAKYAKHLEHIAKGSGRVIPDSDAKQFFNIWRRKWREKGVQDTTGFINRVPAHILKVAICLCLADYNSTLVINQGHIEEAIDKVEPLAYTSKRASEGKGADPLSAQTKMVLEHLIAAPNNELKRRQLLVKGYGNYDGPVLDKIMEYLIEINWVSRERLNAGKASDWIYKLAGEPLEQYKKFLETRGKK